MINRLPELKETPSQTAGPYVHIGLTPNFCDIGGVFPLDAGITMLAKETLLLLCATFARGTDIRPYVGGFVLL